MRAFFAQVAAILALIPRLVWKTITVGGRLVRQLVSSGPAHQPQAPSEPAEAAVEDMGRYLSVREVAQVFLRGQVPAAAAVDLIDEGVDEWLEVMDTEQLRRVATASPEAIKLHLAGTPIRGVLRYERAAIDDYRRARERPAVSVMMPEAATGLAM